MGSGYAEADLPSSAGSDGAADECHDHGRSQSESRLSLNFVPSLRDVASHRMPSQSLSAEASRLSLNFVSSTRDASPAVREGGRSPGESEGAAGRSRSREACRVPSIGSIATPPSVSAVPLTAERLLELAGMGALEPLPPGAGGDMEEEGSRDGGDVPAALPAAGTERGKRPRKETKARRADRNSATASGTVGAADDVGVPVREPRRSGKAKRASDVGAGEHLDPIGVDPTAADPLHPPVPAAAPAGAPRADAEAAHSPPARGRQPQPAGGKRGTSLKRLRAWVDGSVELVPGMNKLLANQQQKKRGHGAHGAPELTVAQRRSASAHADAVLAPWDGWGRAGTRHASPPAPRTRRISDESASGNANRAGGNGHTEQPPPVVAHTEPASPAAAVVQESEAPGAWPADAVVVDLGFGDSGPVGAAPQSSDVAGDMAVASDDEGSVGVDATHPHVDAAAGGSSNGGSAVPTPAAGKPSGVPPIRVLGRLGAWAAGARRRVEVQRANPADMSAKREIVREIIQEEQAAAQWAASPQVPATPADDVPLAPATVVPCTPPTAELVRTPSAGDMALGSSDSGSFGEAPAAAAVQEPRASKRPDLLLPMPLGDESFHNDASGGAAAPASPKTPASAVGSSRHGRSRRSTVVTPTVPVMPDLRTAARAGRERSETVTSAVSPTGKLRALAARAGTAGSGFDAAHPDDYDASPRAGRGRSHSSTVVTPRTPHTPSRPATPTPSKPAAPTLLTAMRARLRDPGDTQGIASPARARIHAWAARAREKIADGAGSSSPRAGRSRHTEEIASPARARIHAWAARAREKVADGAGSSSPRAGRSRLTAGFASPRKEFTPTKPEMPTLLTALRANRKVNEPKDVAPEIQTRVKAWAARAKVKATTAGTMAPASRVGTNLTVQREMEAELLLLEKEAEEEAAAPVVLQGAAVTTAAVRVGSNVGSHDSSGESGSDDEFEPRVMSVDTFEPLAPMVESQGCFSSFMLSSMSMSSPGGTLRALPLIPAAPVFRVTDNHAVDVHERCVDGSNMEVGETTGNGNDSSDVRFASSTREGGASRGFVDDSNMALGEAASSEEGAGRDVEDSENHIPHVFSAHCSKRSSAVFTTAMRGAVDDSNMAIAGEVVSSSGHSGARTPVDSAASGGIPHVFSARKGDALPSVFTRAMRGAVDDSNMAIDVVDPFASDSEIDDDVYPVVVRAPAAGYESDEYGEMCVDSDPHDAAEGSQAPGSNPLPARERRRVRRGRVAGLAEDDGSGDGVEDDARPPPSGFNPLHRMSIANPDVLARIPDPDDDSSDDALCDMEVASDEDAPTRPLPGANPLQHMLAAGHGRREGAGDDGDAAEPRPSGFNPLHRMSLAYGPPDVSMDGEDVSKVVEYTSAPRTADEERAALRRMGLVTGDDSDECGDMACGGSVEDIPRAAHRQVAGRGRHRHAVRTSSGVSRGSSFRGPRRVHSGGLWLWDVVDARGRPLMPPPEYIYKLPVRAQTNGVEPLSDLWFWGIRDRFRGGYAPPPAGAAPEPPRGWEGPAPWEEGGADAVDANGYVYIPPTKGKPGDAANPTPFWFWGMKDARGFVLPPPEAAKDVPVPAKYARQPLPWMGLGGINIRGLGGASRMRKRSRAVWNPDNTEVYYPGQKDAAGVSVHAPSTYIYKLPEAGIAAGREGLTDAWFWGVKSKFTDGYAPPPEGCSVDKPAGWEGPAPWERDGGEEAVKRNGYVYVHPATGKPGDAANPTPFWFWGMRDAQGGTVRPPVGVDVAVPEGWEGGLPWSASAAGADRDADGIITGYKCRPRPKSGAVPPAVVWTPGMRDEDGARITPPASYIYKLPVPRCVPGKEPASDVWFWGATDRFTDRPAPPPPGQAVERPPGWEGPAPWERGGEAAMRKCGYTFVMPPRGKPGDAEAPWPFWFWGKKNPATGEDVPPPPGVPVSAPTGRYQYKPAAEEWFWGVRDRMTNKPAAPPAGMAVAPPPGWEGPAPWEAGGEEQLVRCRYRYRSRDLHALRGRGGVVDDRNPWPFWFWGMKGAGGEVLPEPAEEGTSAGCDIRGYSTKRRGWYWGKTDRRTGRPLPPPPGQQVDVPPGWEGPAPWERGGPQNMAQRGYKKVRLPRGQTLADDAKPWPFWFWGMKGADGVELPEPEGLAESDDTDEEGGSSSCEVQGIRSRRGWFWGKRHPRTGKPLPPPPGTHVETPPGWVGPEPWQPGGEGEMANRRYKVLKRTRNAGLVDDKNPWPFWFWGMKGADGAELPEPSAEDCVEDGADRDSSSSNIRGYNAARRRRGRPAGITSDDDNHHASPFGSTLGDSISTYTHGDMEHTTSPADTSTGLFSTFRPRMDDSTDDVFNISANGPQGGRRVQFNPVAGRYRYDHTYDDDDVMSNPDFEADGRATRRKASLAGFSTKHALSHRVYDSDGQLESDESTEHNYLGRFGDGSLFDVDPFRAPAAPDDNWDGREDLTLHEILVEVGCASVADSLYDDELYVATPDSAYLMSSPRNNNDRTFYI